MSDVWFGPGLTPRDFHAFLEALALDRRNTAPLLAIAASESAPARLLIASRAFFDLFGVDGPEALSHRLLAGGDPGARRLADLFRLLPLDGPPRLERLRFLIEPGNEAVTFLCRCTKEATGEPVFVAAALDVRSEPKPRPSNPTTPSARVAPVRETTAVAGTPAVELAPTFEAPTFNAPMSMQAIHEALAANWPANRRVRFLWRTDADGVLREISAPLAEAVGRPNGDLVGQSLLELAPRLDPTGRLADAMAGDATWSGVHVDWPITDAPGAVAVSLGAITALNADRVFDGFRGYGVIHLDKVVPREPMRLVPPVRELGNVVSFPGGQRNFSAEDQIAFDALGVELRNRAGLAELLKEVTPEPVQNAVAASTSTELPPTGTAQTPTSPRGNGFAVLDKLAVGILVSRGDVPIFANRHLLEILDFADEDALHDAGGLAFIFGGEPRDPGGDAVNLRRRDGATFAASTRVQRIEWDELPATLLTLQAISAKASSARRESEHDTLLETSTSKHAEERRRDDSELRHLRAILETATDGVAVVDAKGDVVSLNRSGEALLGRDRGTVIGRPFLDLFAPDTRELASNYLDDLASNGTRSLLNSGHEIEVKASQGGTIPVFMTLGRLETSPLDSLEPDRATARFCALFRDLTHWKKVEHELETARLDAEGASAAKTDFLAKVSHEVRTPLNAIIGFAEMILEERFGPVGNARYRDYLRDIHTSGTHVMSLVNDLLDLSKIEAGRMELSPTAVDANKIITECAGLMQPQASRERVIMRMSLSPTLPKIHADERSLRQIVLNLLSNAVKYNEPGGQVIIASAAPEDGKVVIRVRDTGTGMSEADIAAALEPFRQVSTRPMTEGTGLGLPLTKALVEANEATFLIRSKVDHGTLIEVTFPPARVLAGRR